MSNPTTRHRAWFCAAATALAALTLTACSMPATGTVSTGGAASAPVQAADSNLVNVPLGGSYKGPTLSIGLSKPTAYTPSESAMVTQQTGRAVAFNLSVTDNATAQSFPAMALSYQATSGSTQDQSIEDSANNVGSSTATILPGHSLTWAIAFSVPKDATDITVQVSSIGGGKTIVFAGKL